MLVQAKASNSDGTVSPDSTAKDICGHGDAKPDSAAGTEDDRAKHGCGDWEPRCQCDGTRVPRRSSLKGSNPGRRASIGACLATIEVEVYAQGEGRSRVQRRRSIDFNKNVGVVEIPKIKSRDKPNVWLQPEDFDQIEANRLEMKNKMLQGGIMPWEEEETRGLEHYVDDGTRSESKHKGWNAVFDEQSIQGITGDFNEERIADSYKRSTQLTQQKAAVLGRADHRDVSEYLQSPRTQKLMLRRLPMRRSSC